MRIPLKSSRSGRKGYALMIVLCFVFITLYTLGSLMQWTASSSKLTSQNNQFLASESAAESADEIVVATMTRDYLNQALNAASAYTSLVPTNTPSWPMTYTFTDASNTLNRTTVILGANGSYLTPLSSQFANLQGYIQPVTISSTATPTGRIYNVPATVVENIEFDTVPIFQFAIFYNLNLEMSPGSTMTVVGPVYCNAGIWACNSGLTFLSSVDSVGINSYATTDPFSSGYTSSGVQPNYTVNPLTNEPSLTMPISGTNNSAASVQNILNWPPTGQGAPSPAYLQASNQTYIFNLADLIISNSASGTNYASCYATNITIYYENSNVTGYLSLITNDIVVISNNGAIHTTNKFYSFATNRLFYDYRESDTVQALEINVTNFTKWLYTNVAYFYSNGVVRTIAGGGLAWNNLNTSGSTSKGHNIDSIYVYNNVQLNSGQLPAVRVIGGAQLPAADGLTIATPQPLYVYGNYNVQTNSINSSAGTTNTYYTYPAALMGDAITILSGTWQDSWTNTPLSGRFTYTTDTVNAACLSGIVQTVPTISANYSGGVPNYLRFLENWNNGTTPLYYNGSIICMFASQYATNFWQNTGGYYYQPVRDWAFDVNFKQASKLPPLTPSVKVMLRTPGGWSAN
jgi:hypothetical protein